MCCTIQRLNLTFQNLSFSLGNHILIFFFFRKPLISKSQSTSLVWDWPHISSLLGRHTTRIWPMTASLGTLVEILKKNTLIPVAWADKLEGCVCHHLENSLLKREANREKRKTKNCGFLMLIPTMNLCQSFLYPTPTHWIFH